MKFACLFCCIKYLLHLHIYLKEKHMNIFNVRTYIPRYNKIQPMYKYQHEAHKYAKIHVSIELK